MTTMKIGKLRSQQDSLNSAAGYDGSHKGLDRFEGNENDVYRSLKSSITLDSSEYANKRRKTTMTLTICDGDFYDTHNKYAGYIHLLLSCLYFFVSIFFMWNTMQISRKYKLWLQPALLALYLSLDGIVVGRVLYFLGGIVLCYSEFWYEYIIGPIPGVFKVLAFLLYLVRVCVSLEKIDKDLGSAYATCRVILLVFCYSIPIVALSLMIYSGFTKSNAFYVFFTTIICTLFIPVLVAWIRFVCVLRLGTAASNLLGTNRRAFLRQWITLNSLLLVLLVLWTLHLLNNSLSFFGEDHSIMYVLWAVIFLELPEMIAAIIISALFFFDRRGRIGSINKANTRKSTTIPILK